MSLPSSAPITLSAIQTEWGASSLSAAATNAGVSANMLAFLNKNNTGVTPFYATGYYTWYVPPGVTEVNALVIAGGGGGGGGSGRGAQYAGFNIGGGGGGGGGAVYSCMPATAGQSFTVYVGAGGAGGNSRDGVYSSGSAGSTGTLSYALYNPTSAYVVAYGGVGGAVSPTGTGGSYNTGGGSGLTNDAIALVTPKSGTNSTSGSSIWGFGGKGAPGYTMNTTIGTALASMVGWGSWGSTYSPQVRQYAVGGTGYGGGGSGGGTNQTDRPWDYGWPSGTDMYVPVYSSSGRDGAAFLWYGYSTVKTVGAYSGGATGPSLPPAAGTLIYQYCSGYDLYGTYHDGNGGSYNAIIEYNSASCGYVPPPPPAG
jgi:hypothetical protein